MGSKTNKPKIAIISRESDEKTLDVAMLEGELLRQGARVKVLSKLLTKEKPVAKALGYAGHVLRQETEILSSDVVVLDTYCIPISMLPRKSATKVVQIWHALGAVKKFGWQTVGMPDGTSLRTAERMHMHRGYDYVASPSSATDALYKEAFRVGGDKLVRLGLPRIDYIKSVSRGDEAVRTRELVETRYPVLAGQDHEAGQDGAGKKTVLYAPTFRRGRMPDVLGVAEAFDPARYNILVKLHPLYSSGGRVFRDNIVYDDDFLTYDLLAAADIVISDYSALVIEATLAGKPLYLYTYDEEDYKRATGLNLNFREEAIGRYAFKDAAELAKSAEETYDFEALREFGQKYIEVPEAWEDMETFDDTETSTGSDTRASSPNPCTGKLAEFILSLAEQA